MTEKTVNTSLISAWGAAVRNRSRQELLTAVTSAWTNDETKTLQGWMASEYVLSSGLLNLEVDRELLLKGAAMLDADGPEPKLAPLRVGLYLIEASS